MFVDTEKVEEVASHFLCRRHGCKEVHLIGYVGHWRETARQDGLLYLSSHCEVALDGLELVVFLLRPSYKVNFLDGLFYGALKVVEVYWFCCEVESTIVHGRTDVSHITVS